MTNYETLLDRDFDWALSEGSRHFEGSNAVHETLRRLARRLDELGIDYAVVGAMAMFFHGYRRFTVDIDVVVTPHGLLAIEGQLVDHGYLRQASRRYRLRDVSTGVRIDLLTSGALICGDGCAGMTIPDPSAAIEVNHSIKVLELPRLFELKLATGRSPTRMRDLADAQAMIQELDLPLEYCELIHPTLRDSFNQLWKYAQVAKLDDY
jgi:hypothetical protein